MKAEWEEKWRFLTERWQIKEHSGFYVSNITRVLLFDCENRWKENIQLVDTLYATSLKCNSMGCQAGEHSSREEHLLCAHIKSW